MKKRDFFQRIAREFVLLMNNYSESMFVSKDFVSKGKFAKRARFLCFAPPSAPPPQDRVKEVFNT